MEKKNYDISIIVPVYNTSKYIEKCLTSIVDAMDETCEVIVVNDGSTDNSENIIKEFIEKLPKNLKNNFSYYYKKNKGLADTKNFGIKKSKGKYISVIDSDDYISSDFYSVAKKYINEKYDMIVYDLYVVFENKQYPDYVARAFKDGESSLKLQVLNGEMQGSSCNKIIKKSLYKYDFPVGKQYEDVAVTPFIIEDAKKIKYLPYGMYYYLQRGNSIVNTNTLSEAFYKICSNIQCVLNTNDKINKYFDVVDVFYLKRTIENFELDSKHLRRFKKNLIEFKKNNKKIINYICKNNEVITNNVVLTPNQKKMLIRIYNDLNTDKYSDVVMLMIARKVINRLRTIVGTFKKFLKSFIGGK